jgi:hypothetical protein
MSMMAAISIFCIEGTYSTLNLSSVPTSISLDHHTLHCSYISVVNLGSDVINYRVRASCQAADEVPCPRPDPNLDECSNPLGSDLNLGVIRRRGECPRPVRAVWQTSHVPPTLWTTSHLSPLSHGNVLTLLCMSISSERLSVFPFLMCASSSCRAQLTALATKAGVIMGAMCQLKTYQVIQLP